MLHIAASTSVIFDRLFWLLGKLTVPSAANQYVEIYTLAAAGNFPYLVVSKNAIKGQRLQLNLGSLLSSWFVWGAIAQQIAVVRMKLVVMAYYLFQKYAPQKVAIS